MGIQSREVLMEGLETWTTDQKFRVVQLHYTADPKKRSAEWLEQAKSGIPKQDWDIEYEISWVAKAGRPVLGTDFIRMVHIKPVTPISAPVWVGWDFGFHAPAACALQVSDEGQLRFALEIPGHDIALPTFVKDIVLPKLYGRFPHHYDFRHCADVAGRQKNDLGGTAIEELKNALGGAGVEVFSKWAEIETGLNIIRRKMAMRRSEEPLAIFDPSCTITIEGVSGAWVYPYSTDVEIANKPDEKGPWKHIFDAWRFAVQAAAPDEYIKKFQTIQIPTPSYGVSQS